MIGVGLGLGLGLPLDLLLLTPVPSVAPPPTPTGSVPLAWLLACYPAGPTEPSGSRGIGGVVGRGVGVALQVRSPNTVVVSAITDAERLAPVTPASVTWRLLEGTTPRATGTFSATGSVWRAVLGASVVASSFPDARLEITVAPAAGDATVRVARVTWVED